MDQFYMRALSNFEIMTENTTREIKKKSSLAWPPNLPEIEQTEREQLKRSLLP